MTKGGRKGKVDRMADFHGVALVSSSQGRQACRRPVSAKSALRRALPLQTAWTTLLRRANTCAAMHVCVKKVIAVTVPTTVPPRSTNCENWDLVTRSRQLGPLGQTTDLHNKHPPTVLTLSSNAFRQEGGGPE